MSKEMSTLDYVIQNFPAYGDPTLEALRRDALDELSTLRKGFLTGRTYRGVTIYTSASGKVFIMQGSIFEFDRVEEAETCIDSLLAMAGVPA